MQQRVLVPRIVQYKTRGELAVFLFQLRQMLTGCLCRYGLRPFPTLNH